MSWKSSGKLTVLLTFFLVGFCDLLQKHTTGKERFARFLFAWHQFVGTIVVSSRETPRSKEVWKELCHGHLSIPSAERSAVLFAVASCAYAFLKLQVSIIWDCVIMQHVASPCHPCIQSLP